MIEYLTTTIDRYRNKATKILQYGRNIMLSSLPLSAKVTLWEFLRERHNMSLAMQTMEIAKALSITALTHVEHPEISINDEGNLLLEFNLNDDRLVFTELDRDGQLAIEVYGPGDRMGYYPETTHQKFLEIIEAEDVPELASTTGEIK